MNASPNVKHNRFSKPTVRHLPHRRQPIPLSGPRHNKALQIWFTDVMDQWWRRWWRYPKVVAATFVCGRCWALWSRQRRRWKYCRVGPRAPLDGGGNPITYGSPFQAYQAGRLFSSYKLLHVFIHFSYDSPLLELRLYHLNPSRWNT
jgi:hypothetical protein